MNKKLREYLCVAHNGTYDWNRPYIYRFKDAIFVCSLRVSAREYLEMLERRRQNTKDSDAETFWESADTQRDFIEFLGRVENELDDCIGVCVETPLSLDTTNVVTLILISKMCSQNIVVRDALAWSGKANDIFFAFPREFNEDLREYLVNRPELKPQSDDIKEPDKCLLK